MATSLERYRGYLPPYPREVGEGKLDPTLFLGISSSVLRHPSSHILHVSLANLVVSRMAELMYIDIGFPTIAPAGTNVFFPRGRTVTFMKRYDGSLGQSSEEEND